MCFNIFSVPKAHDFMTAAISSYYSGEYPRLSRGKPGFNSPTGRVRFFPSLLFLFCRLVCHNYHSYFSSFGRLVILDPGDNES